MALYELVRDGEPVERVEAVAGGGEDRRLSDNVERDKRRKDGWRRVAADGPMPEPDEDAGE